jgi:citrate synthase
MSTTTTRGLEGVVAAESEICYIDGEAGILSYRGFNIHTLADNATFEEVIYLLWHGALPKAEELERLKAVLVQNRPIPDQVVQFLGNCKTFNPMDVLRTAVSMLGLYDPDNGDNSEEANVRKAERLMAQTATVVTTFDRLRNGKSAIAGDPKLGGSSRPSSPRNTQPTRPAPPSARNSTRTRPPFCSRSRT